MEILNLYKQGDSFVEGVWEEPIDHNDEYSVSVLHIPANMKSIAFGDESAMQTYYVLEGEVEPTFMTKSHREFSRRRFETDQGWSLMPNQKQILKTKGGCLVFAVKGPIKGENIDDYAAIEDEKIQDLNNYHVNKPWGSERWLVDNGIYVVKAITMNSGHESSLQVHEQKIEVNLVLKGRARVMLGFDEVVKNTIISHNALGGDQSNFSMDQIEVSRVLQHLPSTVYSKYQGWTVSPYQIHKVISETTYFALEVSTPEVDDVVRLKDLNNRPGGRISNEHSLEDKSHGV